MNGELSRTYLLLLAAGIDPMTGNFLPEESVVKRPEVVEALRDGVEALREQQKLQQLEATAHETYESEADRRWEPWLPEEEKMLRSEYEKGTTITNIAKKMHRTRNAIRARLKKLGLLE